MRLGWLRAVAQGYNYCYIKIKLGIHFKTNNEFENKLRVGLRWLRAMTQGHNYSYNTIELALNLTKNNKSSNIKLSWGLDGCAR